MTLYRLPDNLGGREVECTLYEQDGNTWLWFSLDGKWMIHTREEALTKVSPPLPPEPPVGAILAGGGCHWLHGARGWFDVWTSMSIAVEARFLPWADLFERYGDQLVPLVPDPAFGCNDSKFSVTDNDGDTVEIEKSSSRGSCYVNADSPGVTLAPSEARRAAAKLLHFAAQEESS